MFTLDNDPVDGTDLIVAGGELDLAATSEKSAIFAMSAAGPQDAVVLDLIAVDLHRSSALGTILRAAQQLRDLGKTRHVVAQEARAASAGDHRHRVALLVARLARPAFADDLARFEDEVGHPRRTPTPSENHARTSASRSGAPRRRGARRRRRAGNAGWGRDHAQAGGVRGLDAVLGVLDRDASVDADVPHRFEIDVRRGFAARDLFGTRRWPPTGG